VPRFDVYGRYEIVVERIDGAWRVLQVGADGKRGLRADLAIPLDLPEEDLADYLDVLLHEGGSPGASIRRVG